ncbi:TetR family transcriptional regulator [Microbacterium sp. JZ31]|uniref:TetR family transcriptional regulator n=1 Tax=Microbacterium sp. JZ31 TaxID=1906274 RepID=UPI003FA5EA84
MAKRQAKSRPETARKRAEILHAAMETFGAKGFANGTLAEIADHVDMTHAGVLHHFGSKTQLLLEVLTYRDETDVADLVEQHIPGGMELFRHLVRTAFVNARRAGIVQAFAVLSGEAVTDDHPARAYFEERYRNLRAEVARAFEAVCAERGITAPGTVADASASILAVMDGLQVQWLLDPDAVDLARASEFAIEAIVAAVLDPREPVVATPRPMGGTAPA